MSKQDTAIAMRRLANLFKGVVQAADDIEAIGSLENSTREATEARDKAVIERDAALAELADAKAKAKAALEVAAGMVDGMLFNGQAKADALVIDAGLKAQTDAEKTVTEAQQHANEMVADAEAHASRVRINADALADKAQSLTSEVADLESKRKAAQTELDKLTRALDKIKAQFRIDE